MRLRGENARRFPNRLGPIGTLGHRSGFGRRRQFARPAAYREDAVIVIKRTKNGLAGAQAAAAKPSRPKRNSVDAEHGDARLTREARPGRSEAVEGGHASVGDQSGPDHLGPRRDPSALAPTPRPTVPQSVIEIVPINDLRADPHNARKHPDSQIELLASSILKFGFHGTIGIDENNQIVFGHGRWEALKRAGKTHAPCERLLNLTAQEKSALALSDNRLGELSEWNIPNLTMKLEELSIGDLDFDLEVTGFDTVDLDRLLGPEPNPRQSRADEEGYSQDPDDRTPTLQDEVPAISQSGDLWQLGRHKLLHGDALDPQSYTALLNDEVVAQAIIDGPYNVPNRGHVSAKAFREFAMAHGEMSSSEFARFLARSLVLAARAARDGAIFHVFMDHGHMRQLLAAADEASLEVKILCVWVKPSPGMGSFYRNQCELVFVLKSGRGKHINNFGLGARGRNRSNVWPYPAVRGVRRGVSSPDGGHPTPKPVSLVIDAIRDCSMRGDIVLDPFGGSGTTLIASERIGRRARLLEIDGHYCDLIIRRWQTLTGDDAVRAGDGRRFDEIANQTQHIRSPRNLRDRGSR
jgi:DNA modification methylase